jgi:hypothetical protein
MDTGGFKGAGREFTPSELRKTYLDGLGLPPGWCVNEYGMTEMLSQLYDTALRDAVDREVGPRPQGGAAVGP